MGEATVFTTAMIILVPRIWSLTIETMGPPSIRNLRQAQKDSSVQTLSHMWPPHPPPLTSGPWPPPRAPSLSNPSIKLNTRIPSNQRPLATSSSKKPPVFVSPSNSLRNQKPPGLLEASSSSLFSKPPGLLEEYSSYQNSPGRFEASSAFIPGQRIPGLLEDSSKFASAQRPSGIFNSQLHSFKDDIKTIQSNYNQLSHSSERPDNLRFHTQLYDASSNTPQTSDTHISESINIPQIHREQEFQIPNRVFPTENKQTGIGLILQSPSETHPNHPQFINWRNVSNQHSSGQISNNLQKNPQLFSTTDSKHTYFSSAPQLFQDFEPHRLQTPVNQSTYSIEPNIQVSQSIEASEHHSTYHNSPLFDQQPSAITLTTGPDFGSAATSLTTHYLRTTVAPEFKKKLTLKDILAEDCPNAKDVGYCISPPRYPSSQIFQIIARCAELLQSLYAPEPEDEEDTGPAVNFNTTRTIERGNRHVWSWAHPGDSQRTVCDSDRRRIEPGYVQEAQTGHWFVVLQASSLYQRVTVDICRAVGKPCNSAKCTRGSGFRNGSTKSSQCVQRYSYSHLIIWDPDNPNVCPKIRVFKFPTSCVCYLTSV